MDQLSPKKPESQKEIDLNLLFSQVAPITNPTNAKYTNSDYTNAEDAVTEPAGAGKYHRRIPEPILSRPDYTSKSVSVVDKQLSLQGHIYATGALKQDYQEQIETLLANESAISGKTVQQIRELSQQSIDSLHKALRLSQHFLRAVEENNYAQLPEMVYVKGFLRSLLKFLNVHQSEFIIQEIAKNIEHWKITQKKN